MTIEVFIFISLFQYGNLASSVELLSDSVSSRLLLSSRMSSAIEHLRTQMPVGINELKIPILDPLKLKDINYNQTRRRTHIIFTAQTPQLEGLSTFSGPSIDVSLRELRLSFDLKILNLALTSENYTINGTLGGIIPMEGKGKMMFQINDVDLGFLIKLNLTSAGFLQVGNLTSDLNFSTVNTNLQNFTTGAAGGTFRDILSRIMKSIGKSLFEKFKRKVVRTFEKAIERVINRELRKFGVLSAAALDMTT